LAGGLVSAVLVGGGAFAVGLVDTNSPVSAPSPGPALVGAKQTGDVAAIYAAARNSVVSIKTSDGSGTGFVVDANGTIVTNAHVVGSETTVQVQFADDETVQGTVGGVDRSSDLAVVKVSTSRALKPLALADSGAVRTGQLAVAIGSPFGLSQTTTAGIVSGTGRHIQAPDGFQIDSVIQTDAPINPGNSGGPLLDATGRVIGVNSQIASQSGGSVGIGFAVPSNTVRDVIPRLEKGETIKRAYLGVSTSADSGRVTVAAVTAGGPAASAGLQVGDAIVSVGGKSVNTPDDVAAAIQDRHPGESIQVEVSRGGSNQKLDVTLAERPATATP
jgi:putative serine protease PepD